MRHNVAADVSGGAGDKDTIHETTTLQLRGARGLYERNGRSALLVLGNADLCAEQNVERIDPLDALVMIGLREVQAHVVRHITSENHVEVAERVADATW